MDGDEEEDLGHASTAPAETLSGSAAVNSLILDYYKKFGRKRDLEQYFSLSTAQSDVKDTSGTFWQRMKSENDSSDSGEKKSDSSQELCRISIRCSVPDPCSSQDEDSKTKSESVSPPIITEEATQDVSQNSDDESVKSYGNNSQKSFDIQDTSINKPLSPSSSIASQRKLEWDSLADVGYANESDRKTSASSLSTLERLALIQQYSNNDTKLDSVLEPPTAHSTPLDENEGKSKSKKGVGKKTTKIYKKDVEYLEVNVPHSSENNPPQTIKVNLTKHISFNVEKDGKVTVDNVQKNVSVSPEEIDAETIVLPRATLDKEMQTSLIKSKDPSAPKTSETSQKIPVIISLNTLRRHTRRRKLRMARKKLFKKKSKKNIPVQEKSGEQLSEAESFEYMPGHMYHQNQITANERSGNTAGNKSSLESSGLLTTDSSKGSKHSFTKDLEKSIDILRAVLQRGGDDTNLRKQLIKQVCERLLKSRYRDDESTSDFLSGLSFSSKKLGLGEGNHTTTSTSDNSGEKLKRPKKSILRKDKFNAGAIASTSQSAPNLPTAANSEKLVSSNLMKNLTTSNTDSDLSHKDKSSSDNVFAKTSSQELYQKYLDALKREENYKRHLKDKEMFLKQKLVCSDSALRAPTRLDPKVNNRLKDLIKDLTRNNYDDGSGDASKLEGGPNSSRDYDRFVPIRSQRSHSVFTLSSGNSDQNKQNLKKKLQCDLKGLAKPGTSKEHYCCCPHHASKTKAGVIDSSVQVNIKRSCDSSCEHKNLSPRDKGSPTQIEQVESPTTLAKMVADDSGDLKYVCLCNNKTIQDVPDNFLVFKCSRLAKGNQETFSKSPDSSCRSRDVSPRKNKDLPNVPSTCTYEKCKTISPENICEMKTTTKSSQTNFLLKMLRRRSSDRSPPSSCGSKKCSRKECSRKPSPVGNKVYEATRWLQTEISINPRIPEPSLSDINIVTDCANIVNENCRWISKPSLTDVFSCKQTVETSCNSESSKSSGTSKEIGELFADDKTFVQKPKTFEIKNDNQESGSERSEKFTIPIQGTNMTLMVSIGSNERKNKPEDMIGQCIGTDRSKVTEQGTSLTEECSKGVQYENTRKTDQNSNNVGILKDRMKNSCTVNTCLTADIPTFNTYPKTSPVNERKTLRRANTDKDNFGKCAPASLDNKCIKPQDNRSCDRNRCSCGCSGRKENCTDKCNEKLQCEGHPIGQKESVEKDTQCSAPISPKCSCCDERKRSLSSQCSCGCSGTKDKCKERNKCPCGCSGDKDKCNKNCDERKKSMSTQCSCGCSGDKDKCNKNCDERKKSLSSQCSCGCSGDKDKCNKNCDERKKSLSSQCSCGCSGDKDKCNKNCDERKKSLSSQCSCGCSGDKDKCNKNCDERKKSLSLQCSCGCSGDKDKCNKNCDERKKSLSSQCSCGCSGDKDKCNKNCDELKKSMSTQCSCGCSGDKDKCNKNCDERKKSMSTQCSCGCSGDKDKCNKNCDERQKSLSTQCCCGCSGDKEKCSLNCDKKSSKEVGVQKDTSSSNPQTPRENDRNKSGSPDRNKQNDCGEPSTSKNVCQVDDKPSDKCISGSETEKECDPILEMIQNITNKYAKEDFEKSKRKKCFKEIITVLNYLLETEDSSCYRTECVPTESSTTPVCEKPEKIPPKKSQKEPEKSCQKTKKTCITESSDCPLSTDIPGTSSDSATCKVLNKIKRECERYHQKRCKIHSGKKCDISSSTSAHCDQCRRVHHCACRNHKCKAHKKCEKIQKKAVAYNLILQATESISEETVCNHQMRQLKNVVVKVPSQRKHCTNVPFREMCDKIKSRMPPCSPREAKPCRSRSLPNESEISSMEEFLRKSQACCTVREYLEQNRPDFIAKSSHRQDCLRIVSDSRNEDPCCKTPQLRMIVVHTPTCTGGCNNMYQYHRGAPATCMSTQCYDPCNEVTRIANMRAAQRDLLSVRLAQLSDVNNLDSVEVRRLAEELARHMREKRPAPKFISEKEMKKHSENIYKSLPEVIQRKEEAKKENIRKTNLLMANIFKRNLQKKTLRGSVDISNYSLIIKT